MKIMEKDNTYKVMKIIVDIIITFSVLRIVAFPIAMAINYHVEGNLNTFLDSGAGTFFNISGTIIIPVQWAACLVILYQLRKIIISIPGDRYFIPDNFKRVQLVGSAMLIIGSLTIIHV